MDISFSTPIQYSGLPAKTLWEWMHETVESTLHLSFQENVQVANVVRRSINSRNIITYETRLEQSANSTMGVVVAKIVLIYFTIVPLLVLMTAKYFMRTGTVYFEAPPIEAEPVVPRVGPRPRIPGRRSLDPGQRQALVARLRSGGSGPTFDVVRQCMSVISGPGVAASQ